MFRKSFNSVVTELNSDVKNGLSSNEVDVRREKYGKNAILRATSLEEKATGQIRNKLIGGHNGE